RDRTVTGVQTCALPISLILRFVGIRIGLILGELVSQLNISMGKNGFRDQDIAIRRESLVDQMVIFHVQREPSIAGAYSQNDPLRSEERRVGKECRSGVA